MYSSTYTKFLALLFTTFHKATALCVLRVPVSRFRITAGATGGSLLGAQRGRLLLRGSLICWAKKKKAAKKTSSAPTGFGGGFGATVSKPAVDGKVLIKRSEKDYLALERLSKDSEAFLLKDYMVSMRLQPKAAMSYPRLADWVPCASLIILCPIGTVVEDRVIEDAIAGLKSTIFAAFTIDMSSAKIVSPDDVQYGFEPMASFSDNVSPVYDGKGNKEMNRNEAYAFLGLDSSANKSAVRSAYRKLMMKFHPDRNDSPDTVEKYLRVKKAYSIIGASSMMTGLSWFESLGGSERTFTGPVELRNVDVVRPDDIKEYVSGGNTYAAVNRINPEIINFFAMGNSERGAADIADAAAQTS